MNVKKKWIMSLWVIILMFVMSVPSMAASPAKLSQKSMSLYEGEAKTLKVKGKKKKVKWSSSNSYVATVNSKGKVKGKHTGTAITIDGKSGHYSTNGNITGVMDWGKTQSYTAGIIANYSDITDETIKNNGKSLISNANNNRYVDKFDNTSWSAVKKYAATQWYSSGGTFLGNSVIRPYTVRNNLFQLKGGGYSDYENGKGNSSSTFRPVITGN